MEESLQLEQERTLTNVFQLLLSLLSSDFLLCPPSELKISTPCPGLKGKLGSAIEMKVLVVGFF